VKKVCYPVHRHLGFFLIAATFVLAGCRPQAPECKQYIDCANALNAGSGDNLKPRYGEQGTCWTSSDADAQNCTNACKSALTTVRNGANPPAACQ
jgi:hypothetical protein